MAEPSRKKFKRGLLPDLEEMEGRRISSRKVIDVLTDSYENLKNVNMRDGDKRFQRLDDDVKLSWIMVVYPEVLHQVKLRLRGGSPLPFQH